MHEGRDSLNGLIIVSHSVYCTLVLRTAEGMGRRRTTCRVHTQGQTSDEL